MLELVAILASLGEMEEKAALSEGDGTPSTSLLPNSPLSIHPGGNFTSPPR